MGIQTFSSKEDLDNSSTSSSTGIPRKEELAKRVARIRQEMIEAGELDPDAELPEALTKDEGAGSSSNYDSSEQIRGAFIHSARHLSRQHKRGITSSDRDQRIIKLMLALMVLGLVFWFFFLR